MSADRTDQRPEGVPNAGSAWQRVPAKTWGVALDLPHEDRWSFCAYLAGERPYSILERGPLVSLLVPFKQRGVGHILAVPTAHRPTILDLSSREAAAVMDATVRATRAIVGAYDPKGVAVWQNNGIPARQSIPHVHVHVAGTLPGGGTEWGEVPRLSVAETDAIASRLAPHLPKPPR
jgi:histidine triad (HIT) family protein